MRLGIPLILIQCSDWWAFEILLVLSGRIGVNDQAAYAILVQIIATIFMTPLGISEANCVIVGNSIGENNSVLAWRYWKMSTVIALSYFALITILMILFNA